MLRAANSPSSLVTSASRSASSFCAVSRAVRSRSSADRASARAARSCWSCPSAPWLAVRSCRSWSSAVASAATLASRVAFSSSASLAFCSAARALFSAWLYWACTSWSHVPSSRLSARTVPTSASQLAATVRTFSRSPRTYCSASSRSMRAVQIRSRVGGAPRPAPRTPRAGRVGPPPGTTASRLGSPRPPRARRRCRAAPGAGGARHSSGQRHHTCRGRNARAPAANRPKPISVAPQETNTKTMKSKKKGNSASPGRRATSGLRGSAAPRSTPG
jgi:hypothetical protein